MFGSADDEFGHFGLRFAFSPDRWSAEGDVSVFEIGVEMVRAVRALIDFDFDGVTKVFGFKGGGGGRDDEAVKVFEVIGECLGEGVELWWFEVGCVGVFVYLFVGGGRGELE